MSRPRPATMTMAMVRPGTRRRRHGLILWALLGLSGAACAQSPEAPVLDQRQRRLRDWQEMRELLPPSAAWDAWRESTQELPPDFSSMTPYPFLPDPLRFADGREVSAAEWPRRRLELLALFQHFALGTYPTGPGPVTVSVIRSREEPGCFIDEVALRFGPNGAVTMPVELIIPRDKPTPLPVLLLPVSHRSWGLVAVRRGYICCLYDPGPSPLGDESWSAINSDGDWIKPTRWAWAASRCLDYLHGLPVVDTNQIALAGQGIYGQSALIAAAFDRRVNALIVCSAGPGGPCPWRFTTEPHGGPSLEWVTRRHPDRLHPRMRFFVGRESYCPIDQHELVACVAPRPCLLSSSLHDPQENLWALEHSYREARRVYDLFAKGQELNLHYRTSAAEARPDVIETYLDWLDTVFQRGFFPFPDVAIFPTYATWQELTKPDFDWSLFPTNASDDLLRLPGGGLIELVDQWLEKRQLIRDRIFETLGNAPPFATSPSADGIPLPLHEAMELQRFLPADGVKKRVIQFGGGVPGDLYLPTTPPPSTNGYPAVIWLPSNSTALGYVDPYATEDPPQISLARQGWAVLVFDQIGAGSRLDEIRYFYHRYPLWSVLGKQIDDTLAAFEAIGREDEIDPNRIFVAGHAVGGQVALHAAALEPRLAGVVALAGIAPRRWDTGENRVSGVARWSRWYPLLPRLGEFVGRERQIPYDYHELLALIAPRPAILLEPRFSYPSSLDNIRACVQEAAKIYERMNRSASLQLIELPSANQLSPANQEVLQGWLQRLAGRRAITPSPGQPPN